MTAVEEQSYATLKALRGLIAEVELNIKRLSSPANSNSLPSLIEEAISTLLAIRQAAKAVEAAADRSGKEGVRRG